MLEAVTIEGVGGRPIHIGGVGLLCPAGIGVDGLQGGEGGAVPGFKARAYVPDRKSIKLMSRAVQLGVSAACLASSEDDSMDRTPPPRRGMFVGARAQSGEPTDLSRAFEVSWSADGEFEIGRFARDGMDRIHPLWLVKGLSNNVLGLTSSALDIQGVNSNYCHGEDGAWTALVEAAHAVAEGRVEWCLAGGSDSLVGAEDVLGRPLCGEAGAFVVIRAGAGSGPVIDLDRSRLDADLECLGYLGAATWPVAFVRRVLRLRSAD
jgi:hypothetical protein